jgi:predicted GIY-YIG superfamily endonuclease
VGGVVESTQEGEGLMGEDWILRLPQFKQDEIEEERLAYLAMRDLLAEVAPELVAAAERIKPGRAIDVFDHICHDLYGAMVEEAGIILPSPEVVEHEAKERRVVGNAHETAVYRAFDAAGRLLYVGITKSPQTRMRGHQRTSEWWPEMQSVVFEWHATRIEALDVERDLIESLRPPFNIDHHPETVR